MKFEYYNEVKLFWRDKLEQTMVITLPPQIEVALSAQAQRRGVTPEELALEVLRRQLVVPTPIDDWERRLLGAASDCGVALSHEAVGSDGLYD